MDEIIALEQQGDIARFGERVGNAISEIQAGGVTGALSICLAGCDGGLRHVTIKRHRFNFRGGNEFIQQQAAIGRVDRMDDKMTLDERWCRDDQTIHCPENFRENGRIILTKQDGQDCR